MSYISASSLRNYVSNDPLLDYFDIVKKTGHVCSISHLLEAAKDEFDFFEYVKSLGNQFEDYVVAGLRRKWSIVEIGDCSMDERLERTAAAMGARAEIIVQGALRAGDCHGKPDLLVRGDIMQKIVGGGGSDGYSIVDIKFANLTRGKSGTLLGKQEYKAQLYVYSKALPDAPLFIWGRNGIVPVECDRVELYEAAIAWQRQLRRDFRAWDALQPHCWELLPNMCNQKSEYGALKRHLAERGHELTLINGIDFATRQKIYAEYGTADYTRVPLAVLGRGERIARINRSSEVSTTPPRAALAALPDLQTAYFVDIETLINFNTMGLNEPFIINPGLRFDSNIVYMIGITDVERGYRVHVMDELTDADEKRMLVEWLNGLDLSRRLVHWTGAEPQRIGAALAKHGLDEWTGALRWFDLHKWFVENGVVVRGAHNYKLKDVAGAFWAHGLVDTKWGPEVKGGLDSMMMANKFYNSSQTSDGPLINKVIEYNYVDCQVLLELVRNYVE